MARHPRPAIVASEDPSDRREEAGRIVWDLSPFSLTSRSRTRSMASICPPAARRGGNPTVGDPFPLEGDTGAGPPPPRPSTPHPNPLPAGEGVSRLPPPHGRR